LLNTDRVKIKFKQLYIRLSTMLLVWCDNNLYWVVVHSNAENGRI